MDRKILQPHFILGSSWSGQQNNLKQVNPLVVGLTISRTLSFNWSPAKLASIPSRGRYPGLTPVRSGFPASLQPSTEFYGDVRTSPTARRICASLIFSSKE